MMIDKMGIRMEAITMLYLQQNADGKSPEDLANLYVETRKKVKDVFHERRRELDLIVK